MASGRWLVIAVVAGASAMALRRVQRGRGRHGRPRRMDVFYDGGCGFCLPIVERLRRLDTRGRVMFRDVTREWESIEVDYPMLDREALLTEMHGMTPDGREVRGFDTYRELAWLMPAGWLLVPFLYIAPIPQIGRRVARAIAERRHAAGCKVPER